MKANGNKDGGGERRESFAEDQENVRDELAGDMIRQLAGFRTRRYRVLDKSGWLWDFHSQRQKELRGIVCAGRAGQAWIGSGSGVGGLAPSGSLCPKALDIGGNRLSSEKSTKQNWAFLSELGGTTGQGFVFYVLIAENIQDKKQQ